MLNSKKQGELAQKIAFYLLLQQQKQIDEKLSVVAFGGNALLRVMKELTKSN